MCIMGLYGFCQVSEVVSRNGVDAIRQVFGESTVDETGRCQRGSSPCLHPSALNLLSSQQFTTVLDAAGTGSRWSGCFYSPAAPQPRTRRSAERSTTPGERPGFLCP